MVGIVLDDAIDQVVIAMAGMVFPAEEIVCLPSKGLQEFMVAPDKLVFNSIPALGLQACKGWEIEFPNGLVSLAVISQDSLHSHHLPVGTMPD